jgi:16S rRNA (cytosine1407-C5)-methyltransferase|tara:strand:- start:1463 stop:2479 length:1017 start_codon:yes stop_codon:yes gene_type:complete
VAKANKFVVLPANPELVAQLPDDFQFAEDFCQRLEAVFGFNEAARIIVELGQKTVSSYWLNDLQIDSEADKGQLVESLKEHLDGSLGQPVPMLSDLYSVDRDAGISQHASAENGQIYIQNPASYFAVSILAPQPDEEILDLAAAPGGKTLAIAARMHNTGRLAAVEPIRGRFFRMQANLQRCGVTNVEFYQRDGRSVGRAVPERFDRVLLDAPCSSESRMNWLDSSTYQHWSPRKVKETQRKQKSLIRSAYAALKPGGTLLYCTCSFAPDENELVVASLLKKTDAQLAPIEDCPPNSMPGLTHWLGKTLNENLALTLRVLPDGPWDGFYVAKIFKPVA